MVPSSVYGLIDRRIFVNYRIDPLVLDAYLPDSFRPYTVNGYGIGGFCLLRLTDIRPRGVPRWFGISSENLAHRILVEWTTDRREYAGVFLPRRETDSRLIAALGGRVFSGTHHRAEFDVTETDGHYDIDVQSHDSEVRATVVGDRTGTLSDDSVFDSAVAASRFAESEAFGYSPTGENTYHVQELETFAWETTPLAVDTVASSLFDDRDRFPADSVAFDHALVMAGIPHAWHEHGETTTDTLGHHQIQLPFTL